jgi:hypothetical protein
VSGVHAPLAHYADKLPLCAASQRAQLRESFASLFGALVNVARQLEGIDAEADKHAVQTFKRTCFALFNALLFQCTRADHDALQRSRVFALLRQLSLPDGPRLLKASTGGTVEAASSTTPAPAAPRRVCRSTDGSSEQRRQRRDEHGCRRRDRRGTGAAAARARAATSCDSSASRGGPWACDVCRRFKRTERAPRQSIACTCNL